MGQLLIRNVDDDDIAELKAQAERQRISLEQRLRNVVKEAARKERDEFWRLARESRDGAHPLIPKRPDGRQADPGDGLPPVLHTGPPTSDCFPRLGRTSMASASA